LHAALPARDARPARWSRWEAIRDILQDRGVLGDHDAIVMRQCRHQAKRISRSGNPSRRSAPPGLLIDLEIGRVPPGFVERQPCRHRTASGREIKVHRVPPWRLTQRIALTGQVDFYTIRII